MKRLTLAVIGFATALSVQAYDQFRAGDGTTCRTERMTRSELTLSTYSSEQGNAGVKAEVIIKLGDMGNPLNCKKLQDLEYERLQYEIELLKMQLKEQNTWE